jgi:tetratricopeptide (TPR) repeat protein
MTRGVSAATWIRRASSLAPRTTLLVILLALAGGPARGDDAADGRRLYHRGQTFLEAGDYRAAAEAFEAGYLAAPRVGFLLNIGNCYRKLGELGKARQFYWRFLDAAPKRDPARVDVLAYLRAMEQIEADGVSVDPAAARRVAAPEAPAPVVAPVPVQAISPPAIVPAPPPIEMKAAPADVRRVTDSRTHALAIAQSPQPPPQSTDAIWNRAWFWTAVGVVVAAGVAGLVVLRQSGTACTASLGCARE